MNKTKTILCIGSIAFDTIETPNGNRKKLLGGSATYFSIASSIFTSVKIVGIVGNDYPNSGWDMFKSRNINTDNITVKTGSDVLTQTSTALIDSNIYVDYIYLDTDERRRFAQVAHEYLIEQLQFTGDEPVSQESNNIKLILLIQLRN